MASAEEMEAFFRQQDEAAATGQAGAAVPMDLAAQTPGASRAPSPTSQVATAAPDDDAEAEVVITFEFINPDSDINPMLMHFDVRMKKGNCLFSCLLFLLFLLLLMLLLDHRHVHWL